MTTSVTTRVERLEAGAYRTEYQLNEIAARTEHLTNAVGDLSADMREFRHDITDRIDRLESKMDRVLTLLEEKDKK